MPLLPSKRPGKNLEKASKTLENRWTHVLRPLFSTRKRGLLGPFRLLGALLDHASRFWIFARASHNSYAMYVASNRPLKQVLHAHGLRAKAGEGVELLADVHHAAHEVPKQHLALLNGAEAHEVPEIPRNAATEANQLYVSSVYACIRHDSIRFCMINP